MREIDEILKAKGQRDMIGLNVEVGGGIRVYCVASYCLLNVGNIIAM